MAAGRSTDRVEEVAVAGGGRIQVQPDIDRHRPGRRRRLELFERHLVDRALRRAAERGEDHRIRGAQRDAVRRRATRRVRAYFEAALLGAEHQRHREIVAARRTDVDVAGAGRRDA